MRLRAVIWLFLPAVLAAQVSRPAEPVTVQGLVIDAATEAPIAGATVVSNIVQIRARSRGEGTAPGSPPPSRGVISDSGGRFLIRGLDPARYRLSVSKPGYALASSSEKTTLVEVEEGKSIRDVVIRLERNAVVTGRVTDENGEPMPYVQVSVLQPRMIGGQRQWFPRGSATTNDLGEYRLFDVPPGEFQMSATLQRSTMSAELVDGAATYPTTYYPGVEDPGQATAITLRSGEERPGVDFRLTAITGVRVSGRVLGVPTEQDRPQPMLMVMLVPRESAMPSMMMGRNQTMIRGDNFTLSGVAPGEYVLVARVSVRDEQRISTREIVVGGSDITGIELALHPLATLIVSAVVEGDDPAAVDLAGTMITVTPEVWLPVSGSNSARLTGDAPTEIENLAPGEYRLQVNLRAPDAYLKTARQDGRDVLAGGLLVGEGSAAPVELVISPHAARISGTVQYDGSDAPARTLVLLMPDEPRRHQLSLYKRVALRPDGSFEVGGVAPGSYSAIAFDGYTSDEEHDPVFLRKHADDFTAIQLSEDDRKTLDLKLSERE